MLLRVLPDLCHKSRPCRGFVRRWFSKSASVRKDTDKPDYDISLHGGDVEVCEQQKEKFSYPEVDIKPRVINFPYDNSECENPFERTKKTLAYDFHVAKAQLQGRPLPPTPTETDIVIIGGGIVGSAIAYHLKERCGPGLSITIIEKDSPYLSTSLKVGRNDLYQQLKLRPNVEMAQYAAEFYRKLCKHYNPDLPQMNVDFHPNSSLRLVSEQGVGELEDLSALYRDCDWKHQLLKSSLLKERFPWMNLDDIALGCLGMNKEGICNKWKALSAMRTHAFSQGTFFKMGKLVGFEFVDQSDLLTGYEQAARYMAPRKIVVQSPTGELTKHSFGYLILAAGVSTPELIRKINISNVNMPVPIEAQERFAFNISCPNGPGIEMPMIMESCGLRFRKSDVVNNYTVWEEHSIPKEVSRDHTIESMNRYFNESILPRLVKRVPSFKNSKLESYDSGVVDVCTWDNNLLIGPILGFYNVLNVGGFGNDEFLYAPAVARGMAELVLDRDFETQDLSCFRIERMTSNMKVDDVVESFLMHNKN